MIRILIISLFASILWAGIEDMKTGTWNLQGSSASSEAKWNVNVRQMVSGQGALDILAVQEAGSLPTSVMPTGRTATQGDFNATEYTWNLGTRSRPQIVYVYYAQIDMGANRVNLAIVSQRMADEIFLLPPPSTLSRPILGISVGGAAFFSAHALANGGTDAPAIVHAVDQFFTTTRMDLINTPWMILGDFNRTPTSLLTTLDLEFRLRVRIISVDTITQVSARATLDYAVVGHSNRRVIPAPLPAITATTALGLMLSHLTSDHFPVRFGRF